MSQIIYNRRKKKYFLLQITENKVRFYENISKMIYEFSFNNPIDIKSVQITWKDEKVYIFTSKNNLVSKYEFISTSDGFTFNSTFTKTFDKKIENLFIYDFKLSILFEDHIN